MSLLFYRRPDYLNRNGNGQEPGGSSPKPHPETAQSSKRRPGCRIPSDLSFGEVIRNNTLPPCSLNDFMDYLMYIEYNAECLQFFLWYCGYVERWNRLSQEERDLAPTWTGIQANSPGNARKHAPSRSFSDQAERYNQILSILEKSSSERARSPSSLSTSSGGGRCSPTTNFSRPKSPERVTGHGRTYSDDMQSQQPFRDEITRVTQHYISTDGPRQLNLTHADRTICLEAASHTTHPSALLPAFAAVEDVLRNQSHPNFIRWSVSNCNQPRVVFVRWLSTSLILLGFIVDALLIIFSSPSGKGTLIPAPVRLVASPLWWMGLSLLIASKDGICIILHWNYKRNLRPWEMFADEALATDKDGKAGGDFDEGFDGAMPERIYTGGSTASTVTTISSVSSNGSKSKGKSKKSKSKGKGKGKGGAGQNDQKPYLQSLGPPNAFDTEPWVDVYDDTTWWKRVCSVSITTPNTHLRAVQDRTVLVSLISGTIIGTALGVGSMFIPAPRLF